jgi:hypothetical protein
MSCTKSASLQCSARIGLFVFFAGIQYIGKTVSCHAVTPDMHNVIFEDDLTLRARKSQKQYTKSAFGVSWNTRQNFFFFASYLVFYPIVV